MTVDDLLAHIFERRDDSLYPAFAGWVRESRRFRTFAEAYKDKIRKKLRMADNAEKRQSLFAELETAYRLLGDQRFMLEYEKQSPDKSRAPDFSLTFRVSTPFSLEVTRLRLPQQMDDNVLSRKLIDAVCDKVGQMHPGVVNVLLIIADIPIAAELLIAAMKVLRERAEGKREDFFIGRGFRDSVDFLRQYGRLSMIICGGATSSAVWQNSLAKRPLPKDLLNALHNIFATDLD